MKTNLQSIFLFYFYHQLPILLLNLVLGRPNSEIFSLKPIKVHGWAFWKLLKLMGAFWVLGEQVALGSNPWTYRINNGYQHLKQGILHDKICLLRICGPLEVTLRWCWDVSVQVITDGGFSLDGVILMLSSLKCHAVEIIGQTLFCRRIRLF